VGADQPGRNRLCQRPRHIHAAGRPDRERRAKGCLCQRRRAADGFVDKGRDWPPAGCRRRCRGDLLGARRQERRRPAHAQLGRCRRRGWLRSELCPAHAAGAHDQRRPDQLVRLWRHQRIAGFLKATAGL
ncbi:hypothetical protein LPJ66_009681, partial [Kickxella alabastrina]